MTKKLILLALILLSSACSSFRGGYGQVVQIQISSSRRVWVGDDYLGQGRHFDVLLERGRNHSIMVETSNNKKVIVDINCKMTGLGATDLFFASLTSLSGYTFPIAMAIGFSAADHMYELDRNKVYINVGKDPPPQEKPQ